MQSLIKLIPKGNIHVSMILGASSKKCLGIHKIKSEKVEALHSDF